MNHVTPTVIGNPGLLSGPPSLISTLAGVRAQISADLSLKPRCRSDMISALRTLSRVLGTELGLVPAQPQALRTLIARACPAQVGVSRARWDNVRSLTLKALACVGVPTLRGRSGDSLMAEWEQLSCRLTTPALRFGLSRFLRFCSRIGIKPAQVEAGTFEAFHDALQTMSLNGKPDGILRQTCIAWNQAAAGVPGWPAYQVLVPSFSRRYALTWESFPASFVADCAAFLAHTGNQDPFAEDYAVSVKPSTIIVRRGQLLRIATALASSGVPATDITSLAVLVRPHNAKLALRFFLQRSGGTSTKSLHHNALLIKTVARHWVKAPLPEIDVLKCFASRLALKPIGMVEKNRALLHQFNLPENVAALVNLPGRVFRELAHTDHGRRQEAVRAMLAIAVEVLLVAPMRIGNLVDLELGSQIWTVSAGKSSVTHIRILKTKTDEPFEAQLPSQSVALLATYLDRYRPRLTAQPSLALFPSWRGQYRAKTKFSTALSAFLLEETGIRMNPHLFRHFAVMLLLDADPNNLETARRILGHRSSTTTLRAYANMKVGPAFQRYGELLARLRAKTVGSFGTGARP